MLNVQCPSCGRPLSIPPEEAIRPLLCNGCGTRFVIPAGYPPISAPTQAPAFIEARFQPDDPAGGDALPWPKSPPPLPISPFARLTRLLDAPSWVVIALCAAILLVLIIAFFLITAKPKPPGIVEAASSKKIIAAPDETPEPPAPATSAPTVIHGPVPQAVPPDVLTDDRLGDSIRRAADWLLSRFDTDSHQLAIQGFDERHNALDALCVYALVQAGQSLDDARLDYRKPLMRGLLAKLDRLKMEPHVETYGRGLRAAALAVNNRPEDRDALEADVRWFRAHQKDAAFNYGDTPAGASWDHSNTQYGQLGLWAASEAGVEVGADFWRTAVAHWAKTQNTDGSWSYQGSNGAGTLSMTAAGLASLFVAHDRLDPPELADKVDGPEFPDVLQRGLDWCERAGRVLQLDGTGGAGYTLYGVERIGLASGFKFLGDVDWFNRLAGTLIARQSKDGSWGDEVETSFSLLFLARGRHPVMINKLRFEGRWSNRWRDAANLTHFASRELEHAFNWQVVPIDHTWKDWTDAPLLYLASGEAPKLQPEEIENLRSFVLNGGLLFTHADGGRPAFNAFARDLARKLFPDLPLKPLSATHDVYSILYRISPRPPLEGVSNGVRLLMVHSPTDLAAGWHPQLAGENPRALRTGVNLFLYAAGRGDYRNRLLGEPPPEPIAPTGSAIPFARLRYGEVESHAWDPEPQAWPRFSKWFTAQTSCALPIKVLRPTDLSNSLPPLIAHLTGVEPFELPETESAALRKYVDSGGVLLIDAAGGSPAFSASARALLAHAFPDTPLAPIDATHPLFTAPIAGMDLQPHPALRPFSSRKYAASATPTVELLTSGKGRVIFSPLDLTAGVLGTPAWGIDGYAPASAQSLVKNLAIWIGSGATRSGS